MGAVKIDIHKNEHPFKLISFNDINCIKGLIKYRWMIDSYYDTDQSYSIYEAGNVQPLNQELICLYTDLDNLIEKCKFNDRQKIIIKLLMDGWTEEDIANEFGQHVSQIYKTFDTICEKIRKQNNFEWKYNYIYLNYLPVEWDYKKCSKCGEMKPATEEFFTTKADTKDGLHPYCKNCR